MIPALCYCSLLKYCVHLAWRRQYRTADVVVASVANSSFSSTAPYAVSALAEST